MTTTPDAPRLDSTIETPRLYLVALTRATLEEIVHNKTTPWQNPTRMLLDDAFATIFSSRLRERPRDETWVLRAMIEKESETFIGHIGGHHAPDAKGRIEVGYSVGPHWQRRGFAREALLGLIDAFEKSGLVHCVTAGTTPTNHASQSLLIDVGFKKIGSQVDDDGEEEWIFEATPEEIIATGKRNGWWQG